METLFYELRERYRSLNTKKLIELYISDELTDLAYKLVKEELKRRNISSKEEAAQTYLDMQEPLEADKCRLGFYWFHIWWILIPAILFLIKWVHVNYFE